MKISTVYIGSDHAGFEMKEKLQVYLKSLGMKAVDLGVFASEPPADYPDTAFEVAEKVQENIGSRGILVCGTGIGMCMTANKVSGIRAANCENLKAAEMSRKHNDSNVLCIGARLLTFDDAKKIVEAFLNTEFEAEERHVRRVKKMERK